MATDLPKSDGTEDRNEDACTLRTVKLNAKNLELSIRRSEEALAKIRNAARAQEQMFREFQRRMSEITPPLADLSRQVEAMLDTHRETWQEFARSVEKIVQRSVVPSLDLAEVHRALEAPHRLSETLAARHAEMSAVVDAALRARAGETVVEDAAAAADRIVEEISRPAAGDSKPDASQVDAIRFLVERICAVGEALGLERGHVVTIIVAVVIALGNGRCTTHLVEETERNLDGRFDRVERRLDRSLEMDRRALEEIDDLVEEEQPGS